MSTPTPVTTWADAFGVWHASVPLTGSPRRDADTARAAIRAELVAREAPTWDPSIIGVTRERVTQHGTAVYRERFIRD